MILVLDNNIFSQSFNNLSLSIFDDIYNPWSKLITEGVIVSVDEVYRELREKWSDDSSEGKWLKQHKICFQNTTNEEGYIIADIYKSKKFQEGVKEKNIREGNPEADAFLVAKAKALGGIVVTAESDKKPNSEKVPNIATSQNVPYMKKDDFYKILKNVGRGDPIEQGVVVYKSLQSSIPLSAL